MSENKINFIIAIRGYKIVKKDKNSNLTDVTVLDDSNNKVLLRIIEPSSSEYITTNDVNNMAELIKRDKYHSAILISKHFTDNALKVMSKNKIQHVSQDYMPPFDTQELYLAILDRANSLCQKKCGKVPSTISECNEKLAYLCKTRWLAADAKRNFEEEKVGLLKNQLKIALALTR
jgi:hypothetical protein